MMVVNGQGEARWVALPVLCFWPDCPAPAEEDRLYCPPHRRQVRELHWRTADGEVVCLLGADQCPVHGLLGSARQRMPSGGL